MTLSDTRPGGRQLLHQVSKTGQGETYSICSASLAFEVSAVSTLALVPNPP